jgi:hypothetical protein
MVGCQLWLFNMPRLRFLEVSLSYVALWLCFDFIFCEGFFIVSTLLAFSEKVSIHNVMNTTRLLVNPDIPEAIDFKNGYVIYMVGYILLGHFVVHYLLTDLCDCQ